MPRKLPPAPDIRDLFVNRAGFKDYRSNDYGHGDTLRVDLTNGLIYESKVVMGNYENQYPFTLDDIREKMDDPSHTLILETANDQWDRDDSWAELKENYWRPITDNERPRIDEAVKEEERFTHQRREARNQREREEYLRLKEKYEDS